ncbi:hypothetical protein JK222_01395 [Gluconobacter cerinus]|uniref:hypothetical protein n=1 Tax=Gluconobacter cerinus TaxID=38307 RepID=UPI001B8D5155|nr:hypothetical protein [Gluconobacter cerinus]MBS1070367.1 hypothetical protein [Gluconobacter cerinus]
MKTLATGILSAVLGAVFILIMQGIPLKTEGMSYADLSAILLSAVGVIVAIFGGVLAVAAFWGFNQVKQDAIKAAEKAGMREMKEQIESGTIKDDIMQEISTLTEKEFRSDRMEQRIKRVVDAVSFSYGNLEKDRELDADGDEE